MTSAWGHPWAESHECTYEPAERNSSTPGHAG
jgi:hypothetical protein